MTNNLQQLQRIIENAKTDHSLTSTKVVIEECDDDVLPNLQKEDFPPVFDDSSTSVPKMEETFSNRSQKGSISTTMSDEKSCLSSVSILITDTTSNISKTNNDKDSTELENAKSKSISTIKEMEDINYFGRYYLFTFSNTTNLFNLLG